MLTLRAPLANRLARALRSWHAAQGDPLSLVRCQHIVAVLHGHVSWAVLQDVAGVIGEPVVYVPDVGRLKQLGYTDDAAAGLVACLNAVLQTGEA